MQIHFHDDAMMDGHIELYHRLRLYDETGVNNAKKPVRPLLWGLMLAG
jgi:hypothetical protein